MRIRDIRKKIKHEKRHRRVDVVVFLVLITLLIISCIMVYSSSMIGNKYGVFTGGIPVAPNYFFIRQGIWSLISLVAFFTFAVLVPFEKLKEKNLMKITPLIIWTLLFLPFVFGSINGSYSWIRIGGFSLQPSMIAQIFIIVYMSFILETRKDSLRRVCTTSELVSIFAIPAVTVAIIFLQRDTGVMLITIMVIAIMTFCSNMHATNIKRLIKVSVVAAIVALSLLFIRGLFTSGNDYRTNRLKVFLNPFNNDLKDSADQVINSFIAFGNGGLFGRGLGNSIQKLGYLPEAHTDFILAIIAEEMGYIGVIAVCGLIITLIAKSIYAGTKTNTTFSSTYAIGFASLLTVQFIVNVGGVSASIPMTGVTLPFLSNGGSSLVVLSAGLGIVTNILAHVKYIRAKD